MMNTKEKALSRRGNARKGQELHLQIHCSMVGRGSQGVRL
jgi:hypothetical protein